MAVTFRELQPVLAFTAAHLDDDVSLTALARQAGISRFHLHRLFSAATGETPKQLALRLRLDRAAALLLTTTGSVLDVAVACGFQSHEAFCRAFRRRFHTTPRVYRKRGLLNAVRPSDIREHAALVNALGPCIGLYRMPTNPAPKENTMPYVVEKKELAAQPVLVARRRVRRSDIAATIATVLPDVFLFAQQHGLALAGLPFTRYLEITPGLVTMEPGMRIAAPVEVIPAPAEGGVAISTLPAGFAATTTHTGPYDKLTDAYAAIEQWMEAHGLTASGPPWEAYITDPSEHPDPADWKTEVFWPVESNV